MMSLVQPPEGARAISRQGRPVSLTAHLLIRITVVGLVCWLGVSAAVVWQLQREGRDAIAQQADRLQTLTEQQLRRQLTAVENGTRLPDLARVAALYGRPVCLRYRTSDGQTVEWGCDVDAEPTTVPVWLTHWLDATHALPNHVTRTIHLWSRDDGTLVVQPPREAVLASLWQRLRDLTGLTAATIGALNLLVLAALRRLLRPAGEIVQALDRLSSGDLHTRSTPQGALEFRRIGTGIDHLRDSLAQLTAQRSALTARLIDSQEAERRDLARDLHDELGQCLAALQAVSAGIRMSTEAQEAARPEDTETLDTTIARMLDGLRALLGRLRPPLLESQGLAFALQELVGHWNTCQRTAGAASPLLRAELHLPTVWPQTLPDAVALGLYRATQEALTNAARYATPDRPVRVTVRLLAATDADAATLALDVRNACPRDLGRPAQGTGLGLRMLSERITSLGGTLQTGWPTPDTHELQARWPLQTPPAPGLLSAPCP